MADPARAAKMADRIKVIVAKTLERGLKDPRLGFVTITDVKVTGLSLPNMSRPYIKEGIIESIVLWNTLDLGYLTVRTARVMIGTDCCARCHIALSKHRCRAKE